MATAVVGATDVASDMATLVEMPAPTGDVTAGNKVAVIAVAAVLDVLPGVVVVDVVVVIHAAVCFFKNACMC